MFQSRGSIFCSIHEGPVRFKYRTLKTGIRYKPQTGIKPYFLHMRKQRRRSASQADQCLCFRYIDRTIPLLPKSEISTLIISSGCAARVVSDLVGNPEDRFSWVTAQIIRGCNIICFCGHFLFNFHYMYIDFGCTDFALCDQVPEVDTNFAFVTC